MGVSSSGTHGAKRLWDTGTVFMLQTGRVRNQQAAGTHLSQGGQGLFQRPLAVVLQSLADVRLAHHLARLQQSATEWGGSGG